MLRIHFLPLWFNFADEACEEALYDTALFREFAQIDFGDERAPHATTMLKFRRLLEANDFGGAIVKQVNGLLASRGLKVAGGTMVDATISTRPVRRRTHRTRATRRCIKPGKATRGPSA